MKTKQPAQLNKLEHQAEELEGQVDQAVAHWEKIERDKKKVEQEEIERGVLRGHMAELSAGPEIEPFLDSISKIEDELARRQEELKKLYVEEWPKERLERDSRRFEAEGLQSRFRVLNERVRKLKWHLAQEALKGKKKGGEDREEEQRRRWNEAIIAKEMAKLEQKTKTRAPTPQDIERLNDLKADLARNQDPAQPPPTITPSSTP